MRGWPRGRAPRPGRRGTRAACVVAEEAVDAVADDLREPADAPGDDRRAAGERLDGDQAERFRPRAGHQRRVRSATSRSRSAWSSSPRILHQAAGRLEGWHELVVEVGALLRCRAGLGRDPQPSSGQLGDLDRLDDPLLRRDPADEAQGVAAASLERARRRGSGRCGRPPPTRPRDATRPGSR